VKNKGEVIKNYYEKEKNQKSLTEKDWTLSIAVMFDMESLLIKIIFILAVIICRRIRRAKNVDLNPKILFLKLSFRITEKLETRSILSL